MLDHIISFSIRNKLIIGIFTLGLLVWGVYSLTRLPIDAVPDITNNQVQIMTSAPSQSALDIERLITFPVEQTMATIPRVKEIRSISRFGLSVVTIVFYDDVDIYWGRQQVNERLSEARSLIPAGIGVPEIGPVTTGLGEIYQYIIRPKEGYEDRYSSADLRTIQDWIVRRQLLGTPGVADISSFGGYVKQYEISLDPDLLRSYGLGIGDVFNALEANNQNTGGAYIEKGPSAYFIRSLGLLGTEEDIRQVLVKTTANNLPVYIRDVAEVREGHANRYGAMTYNDKGEAVGAVVLMLKGENSNAVVKRVKAKMEQISKTLPEGLEIETFLDRSELIGRAIGTVEKNLLEGALIVIVVLVIFLGNLRAGLIVASVIPLSMLFAVSMMNLFGVSGNLMSLGAIDFGLIVDGAVIIVEATLHHLGLRKITGRLTREEMNEEVYASASKIRKSAAFGEIIILIVYLPILALVGIEGKMFKPMAQTVSFAILGAFILSLTYVPMMSALCLSKNIRHKKTIADRLMDFLHKLYKPVIRFALRRKLLVVSTSVGLFVGSMLLFSSLGGEFLPTLEEGDFALETRVLTGSSLSHSVDASVKAGKVLLAEFPDEVEKVVGKIGASEIPTDPMPIEACDLIVVLKDKKKWKKARHREELAEKMQYALQDIPGVTFGFLQPIQMRFNELMTGVRQDVAVKIFGENLDTLSLLSKQVAQLVQTVDGARDLYVEEVTGLPQIVIKIDRGQIAKFKLDVETVNQAINAAFAGQSAGIVYEGEKRFQLVVRFNRKNRGDIENVRNLFVTSPTGEQIPLEQLAEVDYVMGPNQIQRENAQRRIIVGFNVRGRDIAGVVKELQDKIGQEISFPVGYYPVYGGQFENLRAAQSRLSVAVPVALALIFLLLYFTFGSFKHALLIFTSIPMAAIGGVFALLIRGMPFSISAGIGFIALFGVAVLNGIVLIAEFNRLKKEGLLSLKDIIMEGTKIRLRPVLMTASVASLGFLPMALATSAGAEVQKPLATVVIGGLISSTLLTLLVLPCLYIYVEQFTGRKSRKGGLAAVMIAGILMAGTPLYSQYRTVTADSVLQIAIRQNNGLMAADAEIEYYRQLKKTASEIPKADVMLMYGQYNSYARNDNNFTITQTIPFPTVFGAKNALGKAQVKAAEYKMANTRNELVYQVRQAYYGLTYLQAVRQLLLSNDTIFSALARSADLRFRSGEGTLLEKTAAETRQNEMQNLLMQNTADYVAGMGYLKALLNTGDSLVVPAEEFRELSLSVSLDSSTIRSNPYLAWLQQQVEVAAREKSVAGNDALPDITIGYFNQSLIGIPMDASANPPISTNSDRFQGFQVGLSIPLWFGPQISRVKAGEKQKLVQGFTYRNEQKILQGEWEQAVQQYIKQKNNLEYYRNAGMPNAELLLQQSRLAHLNGEIGYTEHLLHLRQVSDIRQQYLLALHNYNQSIIHIEFLAGSSF